MSLNSLIKVIIDNTKSNHKQYKVFFLKRKYFFLILVYIEYWCKLKDSVYTYTQIVNQMNTERFFSSLKRIKLYF